MINYCAAMPSYDRYRVRPGEFDLRDHDPKDRAAFAGDKDTGKAVFAELNDRLEALQLAMYAEGKHRLLVVIQAMDAGGKDGTIRSVFGGVNPQGVKVACFKAPTPPELAHDFLWRVHPHVPGNGEIVIFNRSHYEDVLIVRVHGLVPEARWRARYQHIRAFEQMLADEGTHIVKFFLHISKDEQRERMQERIDDPNKRWKFNARDLEERQHWDDYMAAYAEALAATSTGTAPWYVIPADRNWYRDLVVSQILVDTLESLCIELPEADPKVAGLRVT
jgi:PPK2 family polyphosphate:nucleotide phosphotransferase